MKIGDVIYFITDETQQPYIITGYTQRKNQRIWLVSNGGVEYAAYDFEIITEKKYF